MFQSRLFREFMHVVGARFGPLSLVERLAVGFAYGSTPRTCSARMSYVAFVLVHSYPLLCSWGLRLRRLRIRRCNLMCCHRRR
jgi:hypothetical protein